MAKSTKKGNYESLKFLAVLAAIFVIILVIYFISRGSESKNPPIDLSGTTTPAGQTEQTPGASNNTPLPSAEATKAPSKEPSKMPTKAPTKAPTNTPTVAPTKAATATPTPTEAGPTKEPTPSPTGVVAPTPATMIKSAEAKKALETVVDPSLYASTLISGSFSPNGDGETYYRYSIREIATSKQMQPEILVHAITASVYCYQDGKVFDCIQFPLDDTEHGGENTGNRDLTAQEAVKVLLTYGREQLKLTNDPSTYTVDVDSEPTITLVDADGIQAYLITLLTKEGRTAGVYAVSVNGIFVYIRDEEDPNSFIRIVEG